MGGSTPARDTPTYFDKGHINWVKTTDLNNGYLHKTEEKITDKALQETSCKIIPKGAVLVAMYGGFNQIGRTALMKFDGAINQALTAILPDPQKLDAEFLLQWLNFRVGYWKRFASSSRKDPNITKNDVQDFPVPLLNLGDQKKIAAILRIWDEGIEKAEKIKEQRQRLFNDRRRKLTNPKAGKTVQIRQLSDISTEVNHRNDGSEAPVMMISSTQGFIRQDANYDRDMAGDSLQKYILLQEGEFAYNKGNSKTYPYGCIFRLDVPKALIPFVYICFKLSDKLNHRYYRHYFQAGSLNRQLIRLISSSVRGNGLLNINSDDFFSCEIPVPSKEYQDQCADFLDAAQQELDILDKEILTLKAQKRGLMQKLLTGEWPVSVEITDKSPAKKEKKHA